MPGPPVLIDDIWDEILSTSDRHTLSQLMQVCRYLHDCGVKHLLRGEVHLQTVGQFQSFYAFTIIQRADVTVYRLPFVQSLHLSISTFPIPRDTGMCLARFFQICSVVAVNLTCLHIEHAEPLLFGNRELWSALVKMTSIKELLITQAGTDCATVLSLLSCSLEFADVAFTHDLSMGDSVALGMLRDPTSILRHSAHTLQYLVLDGPVVATSGFRIQFPRVSTLRLRHVEWLNLKHLLYAYPNLEALELYECLREFDSVMEMDPDDVREANMSYQRANGTWSSLRAVVKSNVRNLYMLGLICPIEKIDLVDAWDDFDHDMLCAVLSDARPNRLSLEVEGLEWILEPGFAESFSDASMQRLQYLELCLMVYKSELELDIEAVMDALISLVRRTSTLTSFCLVLDWYMLCGGVKINNERGLPQGLEYLSKLTAKSLLGRIVEQQMSLQDAMVMLTDSDGNWDQAHAERKVTSNGM
ncbi:hypothetical protein C8Q76DRAFT_797490 [Earliella scabrosa]|nr:hypothetical protein C8Q76DRAFT_797490 [Earliella scabrosa]